MLTFLLHYLQTATTSLWGNHARSCSIEAVSQLLNKTQHVDPLQPLPQSGMHELVTTDCIRCVLQCIVTHSCQNSNAMQVTFIAGYVIAFTAGWKMTLVITAVMPLLVFSSYMETAFMKGFANEVGPCLVPP